MRQAVAVVGIADSVGRSVVLGHTTPADRLAVIAIGRIVAEIVAEGIGFAGCIVDDRSAARTFQFVEILPVEFVVSSYIQIVVVVVASEDIAQDT